MDDCRSWSRIGERILNSEVEDPPLIYHEAKGRLDEEFIIEGPIKR